MRGMTSMAERISWQIIWAVCGARRLTLVAAMAIGGSAAVEDRG